MFVTAAVTVPDKAGVPEMLGRCLRSVYPMLDALDMRIAVFMKSPRGQDIFIPAKYSERVFFYRRRSLKYFISSAAEDEWIIYLPAEYAFTGCDDIIRFFSSGEYLSCDAAAFTLCDTEECFYAGIRKADAYGYVPADRISLLSDRAAAENTAVKVCTPSSLRYLALAEKCRTTDIEKAFAYINTGLYLCPESRKKETVPFIAMKTELLLEAGCFSEADELCERYTPVFREDGEKLFFSDLTSAAYYLLLRSGAREVIENSGREKSGLDYTSVMLRDHLEIFRALHSGNTSALPHRYEGLPISSPAASFLRFSAEDTETAARVSFRLINRLAKIPFGLEAAASDGGTVFDMLDTVPISELRGEMLEKRLETEAFLIRRFDPAWERTIIINRNLRSEYRAVFLKFLVREGALRRIADKISDKELTNMLVTSERTEFAGLLPIMLTKGRDISPWISRDAEGTLSAIDEIFEEQPDAPALFASADPEAGSTECELLALTVSFEHAAMLTAKKRDLRHTNELFELFCTYGFRYACLRFGTEKCVSGDISDIPDEIKKYVLGGRAVNALDEHRYLDCVHALKEMLFTSPGSALLIGAYNEKLRVMRERSENKLRRKETEMYSSTIKENIRFFIRCGDRERVAAMIAEYTRLNPLDPEIADLLAEAGMTLIDLSDAPLQ